MRYPSRREYLRTSIATVAAAGIAGCIGDDDDADTGDGGDTGDGDAEAGLAPDEFPEFDPANLEFPQNAADLLENNLHLGTEEDFENWMDRDIDEPTHGRDVMEEPDDPDELLEPDTLQYSLGRGEASEQEYIDQLEPLMNNIEEETGIPVEYQLVDSRTAQIEALRAERIHVGNTGAPELAVNQGGAVPYALPVNEVDGELLIGYCWWIISHIDRNDIVEPADLQGQVVGHATETSTSGHQAPSALMQDLFGVEAGEDYEIQFGGEHDAVIRGVELEDYDAGQIAATSFERMTRADQIDPSNFRVLYRDVFPSGPMIYHHKLHPDIKEGIRRATFDYDYGDDITQHAIDGSQFLELEPEDYKKVYDVILRVQKQLGEELEA